MIYNVRFLDGWLGATGLFLLLMVYYSSDGYNHCYVTQIKSLGVDLMNYVIRHLKLANGYCFGLKFIVHNKAHNWLDAAISIETQWRKIAKKFELDFNEPMLAFYVKFFVPKPDVLQPRDQAQYYLQTKQEIYKGSLPMESQHLCHVLSLVVQLELGDFNQRAHEHGYLGFLKDAMDISMTSGEEITIAGLHKQHRGVTKSDALSQYLQLVSRLDMYGVVKFTGKDANRKDIEMGVSLNSVFVSKNNVRKNTFEWLNMDMVSFLRQTFFIHQRLKQDEPVSMVGFNMETYDNAKLLWKTCIENFIFSSLMESALSQTNSRMQRKGANNPVNPIPKSASTQSLNQLRKPNTIIKVRMLPDARGQYGFTFHGGCNFAGPVVISNITANSPATLTTPKIQVQDEIVTVNGQFVKNLAHEDIRQLIRSSTDELILTIKTKKSVGEVDPIYEYFPNESPSPGDELYESMASLIEVLQSGALAEHYKQLPVVDDTLDITDAVNPENVKKNRYRDIIPYDETRVILSNNLPGDYINASHVHPRTTTDMSNSYIAAQGPTKNTVDDFWFMVLQENCKLIIMLTNLNEKGRVKCHQYWPDDSDAQLQLANGLEVEFLSGSIDETQSFAIRELMLRVTATGEERKVKQMHYLVWPDHGVPEDVNNCLEFLSHIRTANSDVSENAPILVHCSAGVGRTGVLILLDMALDMLKCKVPIYPLEMLSEIRSCRPKMVQTLGQFTFVCNGIITMYSQMYANN